MPYIYRYYPLTHCLTFTGTPLTHCPTFTCTLIWPIAPHLQVLSLTHCPTFTCTLILTNCPIFTGTLLWPTALHLQELSFDPLPYIYRYSPVGIMFLVCGKILDIDDPGAMMQRLGMYMLTVILGLFIHAFITLSLVYFAATRKNPFIILRGVLQALVTAFGTGSRYRPPHFYCIICWFSYIYHKGKHNHFIY